MEATIGVKEPEASGSNEPHCYPSHREVRSRPCDFCATCGRPRGLSPLRKSWGIHPLPLVPRTGEPGHHPWQITNDLICTAVIYRNGGTDETTHLCDECLRIGLRAIKVEIDGLLQANDGDRDKDSVIAELTQHLGLVQHDLSNLSHDHNRMQDRLKELLELVDPLGVNASTVFDVARWEVAQGHV